MADVLDIRSNEDLKAALKALDEVWGSDPETPEGVRAEMLMTVIEAYETEHHPIEPPTPEGMREFLIDQGAPGDELEARLASCTTTSI